MFRWKPCGLNLKSAQNPQKDLQKTEKRYWFSKVSGISDELHQRILEAIRHGSLNKNPALTHQHDENYRCMSCQNSDKKSGLKQTIRCLRKGRGSRFRIIGKLLIRQKARHHVGEKNI